MGNIFAEFCDDIQKEFKKKKKRVIPNANVKKDPIPTGSVILDKMFGGICHIGAISEISGMESSAKTTISLHTAAQALKKYKDKAVVLFDFEVSWDPTYANKVGISEDDINSKRMMVLQPSCIEDMDVMLTKMFGNKGKMNDKISLIIIDSVGAARPQADLDSLIGESSQKAAHATAWGSISLKLTRLINSQEIAILLINQIRAKPTISNMAQFSVSNTGLGTGTSQVDSSLSTTGGFTLKYMLHERYVSRYVGNIKEQVEDANTGEIVEVRTANKYRIDNIKNKLDQPYKSANFVVRFGDGFDDFPLIYDALQKRGIIYNKGSFIYYKTSDGNEIKELGKIKMKERLKKEFFEDMKKQYLNMSDKDIEEIQNGDDSEVEEEIEL